ncbi:helix-turn-helix domain-containing protein [Streptomyces sp. NPDC097619]|uniref:PucR family transcriptional regulator n=1 Tax=Streptomyces sp. NPDC097619 TaxID=3157228 RepID=UPI003328E965
MTATDRDLVRAGIEGVLRRALATSPPGPRPADGPAPRVPRPRRPAVAGRARQELFEILVAGSPGAGTGPATGPALAQLARLAGWPLPTTVRAVALDCPGEPPYLASLGDALWGTVGEDLCLLVPDPDRLAGAWPHSPDGSDAPPDGRPAGRHPTEPGARETAEDPGRAVLDTALRGRTAAVGPVVDLAETGCSVRWARRLLALTPDRTGPETRAAFVDDHLAGLLLMQDEPLTRALADCRLRPLDPLTPRQRERLELTLLAWLEGGGAPEAARALKVHPQTVRYRLRQIERLFGPSLRDPGTRFELELALRGRRLAAEVEQVRRRPRLPRGGRAGRGGDRQPPEAAREARINGL